MEISKSTPYVRYRENISSTLHKGTIHIESEYLDRERKTTIESIEGQTWQNMVNGENKEEDILPRLGLEIEGNEDVLDTVEQHMPIDTIIGDVEPIANEDGTYTYEISTMEGSYAKTLEGENNFLLTSDGIVGDMYIRYNAQGEEVNGNIIMDGQQSYTIENSNTGEIKSAILKGQTLVNLIKSGYRPSSTLDKQSAIASIMPLDGLKEYTLILNKNLVQVNVRFWYTDGSRGDDYAFSSRSESGYIKNKLRIDIANATGKTLENIQVYSVDANEEITNMMLLEGDYTNQDIPYFEGMQSVKMPVLTTTGKNLLNDNTSVSGWIMEDGGTDIRGALGSGLDYLSDFIYVGNINQIKINKRCYITTFDENKKIISQFVNVDNANVSNCSYIRIAVSCNAQVALGLVGTIQVEEGSVATSYEPYKSNILTVNEDVELRRIGNVKDELNVATGELTQRIGGIVLDGITNSNVPLRYVSEWSTETVSTFQFTLSNSVSLIPTRIITNCKMVGLENEDLGMVIGRGGKGTIFIKVAKSIATIDDFNDYLKTNNISFGYWLETPIIKTVDLTIQDQDDKIIQSLHTHPSTTHINLSSDGLIPNAEINYTMYGNIGETTGEQITDGADSKLIEGKIYGDTLLNVLPSPSLKNSMDYNTPMQKLNNGYDNVNVVDGEFKEVTLYGQTVVNLTPRTEDTVISNYQGGYVELTPMIIPLSNLKANTKYTVIFKASNVTNATEGIFQYRAISTDYSTFNENIGNYTLVNGHNKLLFTTVGEFSKIQFTSYSTLSTGGSCTIHGDSIMILEGDYTNQDIPYFEGMQSVQMPVLTTTGKNLFHSDIQVFNNSNYISTGNNINNACDTELKPSTTYTLSWNGNNMDGKISLYSNGVKTNSINIGWYKSGVTFTTSEVEDGFSFYTQLSDDSSLTSDMSFNVQLEEGTTTTTYEPYKSNILTVNEDVTLRSNGDICDELNLLTGQLTQRIGEDGVVLSQEVVKTVDLTITDQDNQPQTALHSIANGYINTSSQGLLPKVTYEVPVSNLYYLDMVKPNTQYTTKSSSDCNATIDGVVYPLSANGTFTTPSTITDNLMVLDAQVDDLMFIEGDVTGRDLPYFEGIESVENPLVTVCNKNLLNPELLMIGANFDGTDKRDNYRHSIFIPIEPNTKYCFRCMDFIFWYDSAKKQIGGRQQGWGAEYRIYTSPLNAKYARVTINHDNFPGVYKYTPSWFLCSIIKSNVNIYESYCGTDLKTIPQISLHKIGDVKDELDLVNECVVRRIEKVVLDGSEHWGVASTEFSDGYIFQTELSSKVISVVCDKLATKKLWTNDTGEGITINSSSTHLQIKHTTIKIGDEFAQWLSKNPVTVIYELETPTIEPVRIVPQNPKQSTTSLTLQSPLQKVENVADQLRWNPYKGHYVRYNYIQDGVANSTYTFEDLKDMNERKFVNLYNQRTYIDTDHTVQVISHGLSRYCLAEQGKQYQVRWDWVEQPSANTIKVDLCGNVEEIPSSDNSTVIDVEKFTHQFIQIQGLGLTGKITNLMVIETVNGEIPDVDFFSGIQCIGNTVTIDDTPKVQIDVEQTNGNLFDNTIEIYNNGNNIRFMLDMVRPNKIYTFKHGDTSITETIKYNQKQFNDSGQYTIQTSNNGSANVHYPFELCYADMAKDGIRPRYYDKESFILPMKLCRVGNIYDNLYYDDLKGFYRIQQSIGHKYFTGGTTEVWTMETTNGYRTIKFTCTNANIDQIAYGGTICNQWKHLSTINDDMEGFIIYNGNFVIRVDKDRISSASVVAFKEYLASNQIHLFYQMKTPQMINLTEYPNRIELNTYRDEIFTFFKGMNPTKFTLSVPMDKTYRYEIAEEGQGLTNRVTVNNETISAENVVAVKEVRGQGIANIIENVNNVVIAPMPNHEGRTPSHILNNTKPATIRVHGFEASGETTVANYNVTDKAYQLKVMSSNGDNSLSDYYVLNVPYKLETYADGTKDIVYHDETYNQWHFKGSSVRQYTVASDGMLNETVEVFRGLAPRSGLLVEFKLMFTSGTTNSRMYYSLNGTTYSYTSLKRMTDGNYLYVGIFNTGGTKIDIAYKTDPNEEYTNFSLLSTQVPECFMVNQIQFCTFCEVTLDKQYIYSDMNSPIELDTYDGTTKVFMNGNATDTNIIIRNEGTTKIVNTYTDTEYTVYWKYVDGLGNLKITLGGTTVEVDGKQEYATIETQSNAPQELLYVGGYNLSIKDLMVVKGAKINDLPYFENSREVGTLYKDEEGNKSYKITLVQGGSVLEQRDENAIAFKDDNKHNVVVHKIVGACPTKVD